MLNRMRKDKNIVIGIFFFVFIFGVSITSLYKTQRFYIYNEIDYNEWNAISVSKYETDFISNLLMKYQYVNFNGLVRRLLHQSEMNQVVRLSNGYLTMKYPYYDKETIDKYAENTKRFQTKLEEKGIDYVWFTVPYVVDKYDSQMPIGIEDDYGNVVLNNLTESFRTHEINIVDLREKLHDQGMSTYDIFYKTDHHWTTEGGFWAYNQIVDYIEDKYDVEVDSKIKKIDNYDIIKYNAWHLGSAGQRTGKYYAGMDDFDLIIPKFETYIEHVNNGVGGTLDEMMYDHTCLYKKEYTSRYTYDNVLGGSISYWYNPNVKNDLSIMIIGDSMSKAVIPFLAMSFKYVAFGGSCVETCYITEELIDSYNPDIIISMNHIMKIGNSSFDWGILSE